MIPTIVTSERYLTQTKKERKCSAFYVKALLCRDDWWYFWRRQLDYFRVHSRAKVYLICTDHKFKLDYFYRTTHHFFHSVSSAGLSTESLAYQTLLVKMAKTLKENEKRKLVLAFSISISTSTSVYPPAATVNVSVLLYVRIVVQIPEVTRKVARCVLLLVIEKKCILGHHSYHFYIITGTHKPIYFVCKHL